MYDDVLASGYKLENIPSLHNYNRFDNYELPEIATDTAADELLAE